MICEGTNTRGPLRRVCGVRVRLAKWEIPGGQGLEVQG